MILIDTDIMVDVLRHHEAAINWLGSQGSDVVSLPGLVAMELLQGCRDGEEQRQVEATLSPYRLYWPNPEDCERAYADFSDHRLSHGLSILEALIAQTAVGCGARLATFKEKHYRVVGGLETTRPYSRP